VTREVEVRIDGRSIRVAPNTTILEAAQQAGIEIPTLCYLANLTANGLCRLCVVETEGVPALQAACVTPVRQGAVIHTRSPMVDRVRKTVLEMLASTVDLSQSADVQAMLVEYGARPERFGEGKKRHSPVVDDNPVYIRDYAKCVLCWRCVQVCAEDVQYTHALALGGRGFETEVATYFDKPLPETTCVFCGNCVGVCPTGALKAKREYLFEQGLSPEDVFSQTRLLGKGKRSRRVPRAQGV
jgi:NADH dehydrogenase/NADH:ubiquinone oxidoreductase subunit G